MSTNEPTIAATPWSYGFCNVYAKEKAGFQDDLASLDHIPNDGHDRRLHGDRPYTVAVAFAGGQYRRPTMCGNSRAAAEEALVFSPIGATIIEVIDGWEEGWDKLVGIVFIG